jgi:uncharacterized membrane protein
MSRLRQSILEVLRELGNHSGCHQLPERSFFIHGKQFPVCARCTGVFIGQLLSLFMIPLKISWKIGIAGLSIMGADWLCQEVKIKESTNIRRLLTGALGGFGLFTIYINLLRAFIKLFK